MIVLVGKQIICAFWWLCAKSCPRISYEAPMPFKGNSLARDPQNSKTRPEAVQSLSEGLCTSGDTTTCQNPVALSRRENYGGGQQQSGHIRPLVSKKESETLRVCSRPLCKNFCANFVCDISAEVNSELPMGGFEEFQLELAKENSASSR